MVIGLPTPAWRRPEVTMERRSLLSRDTTPDWRVLHVSDPTCEHHQTAWFPVGNCLAFTWAPDWTCPRCRPRADAMVRWAMAPMLTHDHVSIAMLAKGDDPYRTGGLNRWHRNIGTRVHRHATGPDPRAVVLVIPDATIFLATEPLGARRGEPSRNRWVELPADGATRLLDDVLSGDIVRVEPFFFRRFYHWILEVGHDHWAVQMAVEGLEVNEEGYSLIKAAVFDAGWMLGK